MKTLIIELLALDLAVCDRCGGTLSNAKTALKAVEPAMAALGIQAVLSETLVESEQQAERLRFTSSPTIRIDGGDITGTTAESSCGSCTDLSGGAEAIECRIWPWQGKVYEVAPVAQIAEAILRAAVAPDTRPVPAGWNGVPANIRAFLKGKAKRESERAANEHCCAPTCCR